MSDSKPWQEVVEAIFGGALAENTNASEIEGQVIMETHPTLYKEKRKGTPKPLGERISYQINDWKLEHPGYEWVVNLFLLLIPIMAILLFLAMIGMIESLTVANTSCQDMLNWSIDRIPGRCLAELSEIKPR